MSAAKDICVRVNQEVFGEGRVELLDDLVAEDIVNHAAAPGGAGRTGRQGVAQVVTWIHGAFSDLRYDVHHAIQEGDRVALHVTMHGVHSGEFLGRPPTGRAVRQDQMHVFRVADDRVAEHWAVRDDAGLMRQLAG